MYAMTGVVRHEGNPVYKSALFCIQFGMQFLRFPPFFRRHNEHLYPPR
jgi:hypothetical protein